MARSALAGVRPWTIGVMQGRLSPPVGDTIQAFPWHQWQEEFPRAAQAGVSLIEWIVDADRFDENPLMTAGGRGRIAAVERETGTLVRTVCADCFMPWPLQARGPERAARLEALGRVVDACGAHGAEIVNLPFVDASAIETPDDRAAVAEAVHTVLPRARRAGVRIALETSLEPEAFRNLLDEIGEPSVGVNYDSGNSASLGYNVGEEFDAYGADILSVHIKDRRRGGGTVPLGTGDADLPALFDLIARFAYQGALILQAARAGDEVETVRGYAAFVRRLSEGRT